MKRAILSTVCLLPALAVGCGGSSGGGGTVLGLSTPEQLSVVEPVACPAPLPVDDFPAEADYFLFLDATDVHACDPAQPR